MSDIRPRIRDIPPRFRQYPLVVITIQKRILRLPIPLPIPALPRATRDLVGLQTRLLQNDIQSALGRRDAPARDVRLHGQHGRVGDWLKGRVRVRG